MIGLDELKKSYKKVTDLMKIKNGDGMCAALKIEEFFNIRCKEYKQKYKMNIGVYLTPREHKSQWAA